jgi:hypothetical protein
MFHGSCNTFKFLFHCCALKTITSNIQELYMKLQCTKSERDFSLLTLSLRTN